MKKAIVICIGLALCYCSASAETMTEMRQKMTNGVITIESSKTSASPPGYEIIRVTIPGRGVYIGIESPSRGYISIDWEHPLSVSTSTK